MTIGKNSWLGQHRPAANEATQSRRIDRKAAQSCGIQQGTVDTEPLRQGQAISAQITPLDDRGQLGNSAQVEVRSLNGRDISFHHQLPLTTRRVFVSINDEALGSWEALVDLGWCRFNRMGHYTSGGRFLQPAASTA